MSESIIIGSNTFFVSLEIQGSNFFFSNTLDFLHRQRVRASSRLNGARGGRAPNPVPVAPATQNIAQNPAPAQNPRAMAAAAFAMAEVRG